MKYKEATIGEICEVIAGQSPPSSTYNFDGRGLPFFQGKADFGTLYPDARVWCDEPRKIAEPNDILISVRAPVGPTNLCPTRACIGRGLSAIRALSGTDFKYVLFFLRAIEPQLSKQGRGSTFSAVTQSEIRTLKIPFPPLPVQQQIAAILEKADAAREKRRQANKLTDEFLQSVFLEMFGDPVTNPKGWDVFDMEEICNKITDGTHFSPPNIETGIPYITAKHVRNNGLDFYSNPTYISKEHHREIYKRCDPVFGDILYIKDGVTTGIAAVNRYKFKFSVLSSLALLKPNKRKLTAEYLATYLNTPTVKGKILRQMAGGAIKRLTVAKIKKLQVVVPPINLQQKFTNLVNKGEYLRIKQNDSEKELDNLFNSLMQKAFKGELVS